MDEQRISVDQLRVGMCVRLDLKWYEHPFLFSTFKIKTPAHIQTLRDLGLTEICTIPSKSDQPPPAADDSQACSSAPSDPAEVVAAEAKLLWELKNQRIHRQHEHRVRLQRCEKEYYRTFDHVRSIMDMLVTGSPEAAQQAGQLIRGMVETLLSEREVVVHLMNVRGKDQGAYYHTLNVAILGLLLGKELGLSAEAMNHLGMGAIFHDIGKCRIPKKVLYKRGALSPPERELLRLHPRYGEELTARIDGFPEEARRIIREHHETNDGKGYPDGLKEPRISPLAKITAIANTYDWYCNPHDPENALTPHEALSYLFRRQQHQFEPALLARFVHCLGVFPPGTVVQLSNDLLGIVVSVCPTDQTRPCILVHDPAVPKEQAPLLDLAAEPDLHITRSIRPSQLPAEVFAYLDPRARIAYFVEDLDRSAFSPSIAAS